NVTLSNSTVQSFAGILIGPKLSKFQGKFLRCGNVLSPTSSTFWTISTTFFTFDQLFTRSASSAVICKTYRPSAGLVYSSSFSKRLSTRILGDNPYGSVYTTYEVCISGGTNPLSPLTNSCAFCISITSPGTPTHLLI